MPFINACYPIGRTLQLPMKKTQLVLIRGLRVEKLFLPIARRLILFHRTIKDVPPTKPYESVMNVFEFFIG